MIYRKLSSTGDYTFGKAAGNFISNSPETVAQAIRTALQLLQGEYFPDVSAGVPYSTRVLGTNTKTTYDLTLQAAILNVTGVKQITEWSSSVDPATRKATINCTVDTIYGQATFTSTRPFDYAPGRLDSTFILDKSILM